MKKTITNLSKTLATITLSCLLITGCSKESSTKPVEQEAQQTYKWNLVTSWPKNFPGLGQTPENFAKAVNEMSAGRLKIKVYGAGEMVPGFEVFDSVLSGSAQMGHSAAYYWQGKIPASSFFTAVPFGMNAQETDAWLNYGGGLKLWQKLYKEHGLIPLPGGNTGLQFAGWFNKEVNTLADLQGLKMRVGGIGGAVFKAAGGLPVNMPGGDIFSSLQSGALDAAEWVGPYNDLAFGFNDAAKYYYHSGWQEPAANLEFIINENAFNDLPKDLQSIVIFAAKSAHANTINEYTAKNSANLKVLIDKHNVQLRAFPPELMQQFKEITSQVITNMVKEDKTGTISEVWQSYKAFYDSIKPYHELTEQAYLNNR